MDNAEQNANQFVFGLDIGTRNVVGTVGYREGKDFYVAAQYMKEHETRAMLDGQIHDIGRVGRTIAEVKAELEGQLEAKLTDVCIAAAGRVLKTVTTSVEYEFAEETVVTAEFRSRAGWIKCCQSDFGAYCCNQRSNSGGLSNVKYCTG